MGSGSVLLTLSCAQTDKPDETLASDSKFAPPQSSSNFSVPEKPVMGVESPANR